MPAAQSSPTEPIRQAGVIPFRRGNSGIEFCLITTRAGSWGFPKGFVDPGETEPESALKEAFEEAGLHGQLDEQPLGEYAYDKRGLNLLVTVFLMEVDRADDDWLEAGSRKRRWSSARKTDRLLEWEALRELLHAALDRLGAS